MTTLTRVAQIGTRANGWFAEPIRCSEEITELCYGEYNEKLMDPMTPEMAYILRLLHIPSVIACIACYKWRWLADYFYLVIQVVQCVAVLHLNSTGYNENFKDLSASFIIQYMQYSMNSRRDTITAVISGAFQMFMGLNLVYMRPLTMGVIL